MKRLLLLSALLLFGALAIPVSAERPDSPPGQGPCEHGNTGKPCKEDPQPDHGKDCQQHGNNGGVNEDHCLADEDEDETPDEDEDETPTPPDEDETSTPPADEDDETPTPDDEDESPSRPTTVTAAPQILTAPPSLRSEVAGVTQQEAVASVRVLPVAGDGGRVGHTGTDRAFEAVVLIAGASGLAIWVGRNIFRKA